MSSFSLPRVAPYDERAPGQGALVALATIALAIGWIGYTASDDAAYYEAAIAWLRHAPVAGADHWATRFPLVLSFAALLAIFKPAVAMGVTALGWYAIFLLVVRDLATRIGGSLAGWMTTALLATLPVVLAQATTVSCDLTEASFLLLGIRLIGDVADTGRGPSRAFGAGVAFGAAILCRETTALALFGFVPLFLLGRPVSRIVLVQMAMGCALLLAGEAAFQYALTGDPLHRWTLAFHHDSHIDRAANLEGNLLVHPAIDPLLVLLVNDDFALLFWLGAIAVAAGARRRLTPSGRARLALLAAPALAAFLLVSVLTTKLVLNPRYFLLPAVAAAVTAGIWLDGRPARIRRPVLALAVAANLLMLSVENAHPRWPAEALLRAARTHSTMPIASDAETVHRAELPLAWEAIRTVSVGAARPGTLAFTTIDAMPAGATVLDLYPSPPTVLGHAIGALHLDAALPRAIRRRLIAPNPTMALWRERAARH